MEKRFAIFDMDGTLVDSMGYWRRLPAEFLARYGCTLDADVAERIRPMTMAESAALFIERYGIAGTPEGIAEEMNRMMEAHYRQDVPMKRGMGELLAALAAQNVRMCVASATAEHLVRACLERLEVAQYFEFFLSCENLGVGKDRPDIYLAAAQRFSAKAEDVAVYEDVLFAAKTAKGAGFYLVGVYDAAADAEWDAIRAIAEETVRV